MGLLETAPDADALARSVLEDLSREQAETWAREPLVVWVKESIWHREEAYRHLPHDELSYERYAQRHAPVAKKRIAQAGIRLARILNDLYG